MSFSPMKEGVTKMLTLILLVSFINCDTWFDSANVDFFFSYAPMATVPLL
jgi:hypothetical protein